MPDAVIVSIADAVKDALNAATLSLAFTAERAYEPVLKLEGMGSQLFVTVVPGVLAVRAVDLTPRHTSEWDVMVWIQKRAKPTPAETDPLMQLVVEIVELFRPWRTHPTYRVIGIAAGAGANAVPYPDPARAFALGTFSAAVTLTFRVTS